MTLYLFDLSVQQLVRRRTVTTLFATALQQHAELLRTHFESLAILLRPCAVVHASNNSGAGERGVRGGEEIKRVLKSMVKWEEDMI